MKALKTLFGGFIALTLFAATAVAAQDSKFEEGKHYTVISEQTTNKPELREYFSYYCPACRAYEPYLNEFEKVLPKGVKLEKTHVDFMQQTAPEIQFMLSKALDKGMKNFSIISEAKRNKQTQDKLAAARQLTGVPTMVVNGKYLINSKALDDKNFFADYTALVAHLFTL